jgi:hypothetical protein
MIVSGGEALLGLHELPGDDARVAADEPNETIDAAEALPPAPPRHVAAILRTRANRRVPDMLILAVTGADRRSRLWKVPIRTDTFGNPELFSAEANDDSRTVSALVADQRGFIVAAEFATDGTEQQCQLSFYNPIDSSTALRLPIELREITAIACSPISGNLYAAAITPDGESPGVYRIDDATTAGRPACKAVKIADVEHPNALAFGPDGSLYVATVDDVDSEHEQGKLLRMTGEL